MESRGFMVGLIVGILATVTMDVVAVIALRLDIAGRGEQRRILSLHIPSAI